MKRSKTARGKRYPLSRVARENLKASHDHLLSLRREQRIAREYAEDEVPTEEMEQEYRDAADFEFTGRVRVAD